MVFTCTLKVVRLVTYVVVLTSALPGYSTEKKLLPLDAALRPAVQNKVCGYVFTKDEMRFFSIYQRVAGRLTNTFFANGKNRGCIVAPAQELKKIFAQDEFRGKELSANVTLNTDGTIQKASIANSSGIEDLDKHALELIQTSAPFVKASEIFTYTIFFPSLNVRRALIH